MSKQDDFNEIEKIINQGKGCFIIDLAACCGSPYNERSKLSFKVNGLEPEDYIINKKMPNKMYLTASQKYGRKINKFGYLFPVELSDKSQQIKLEIDFINNVPKRGASKEMHASFLLETTITKENPVSYVRIILNFLAEYEVTPSRCTEDGYMEIRHFSEERQYYEEDTLPRPNIIDDVWIYEDPIKLFSEPFSNRLIGYVIEY